MRYQIIKDGQGKFAYDTKKKVMYQKNDYGEWDKMSISLEQFTRFRPFAKIVGDSKSLSV